MTRMTGPDCAVMCNLINTHTHTRVVNAFNNILYRRRFRPALVKNFLSEVPYAANMYSQEPLNPLLAFDGGGFEVV